MLFTKSVMVLTSPTYHENNEEDILFDAVNGNEQTNFYFSKGVTISVSRKYRLLINEGYLEMKWTDGPKKNKETNKNCEKHIQKKKKEVRNQRQQEKAITREKHINKTEAILQCTNSLSLGLSYSHTDLQYDCTYLMALDTHTNLNPK